MNWLPKHDCSLCLTHNEHKNVYETIENFYDQKYFISDDEYFRAIVNDNVWVLHWHPKTPIGFHCIAASTLGAIQVALKENHYD